MRINLMILGGLMLLAVVLRFISFFPSVINHDESTYLVIADALLSGHTYWVDYIDTKPFGVFGILAGVQWLFGKSIILVRLFAAIWLAFTAFGLYLLQRQWGNSMRVGIASGIVYLFLNSIYTFYGVSPNTETFFNLFIVYGALIVFRRRGGMEYLLAGLLLGLGFLIKPMVAFDALALGLFLILEWWRDRQAFGRFLSRATLLLAGFLVPLGVIYGYYFTIGEGQTFWFHSFVVSSRYPQSQPWLHYVKYPADFLLRYLPVTVFYFMGLFSQRVALWQRQWGMIWSVCSFAAVMAPGIAFGHYFIQFMLPFSFVAGWVFGWKKETLPPWLRFLFRPRIGYSLLGLILLANLFLQKKDYLDKVDDPRIVARYLEARLMPEDHIYTGNYAHILYYLLDRESPVRYVHPSLFWAAHHLEALEIDVAAEVAAVKESDPRFILVRDVFPDDRFEPWLSQNYEVVKSFPFKEVKLLERIKQPRRQ